MRIKNGLVYTENRRFERLDLCFGERIEGLEEPAGGEGFDASGCYVLPGLVDIHTHGAVNEDASDGSAPGLLRMSAHYAAHGVTSFCATTMTLQEPELTAAMETVAAFRREGGARCAGVNLEGPFLSYAKRGAQAAENLHAPDAEMFDRLNARSGGRIRLVTVAPEEPGALEFIRRVSRVCTVSLGHSAADYDTAMAAYAAGASHATHLFNAMPSFLHREPGLVGAALDAGATAELICDGFHIHPSVIRAVWKMFGDRLCLISDSLRCAGMPDGDYELGGQPIVVKDGLARLLNGSIAGSSITVLDALRNVVRFGLPLEGAVWAATGAPAGVIGASDIGVLAPGRLADAIVLDRDLALKAVFIGGRRTDR